MSKLYVENAKRFKNLTFLLSLWHYSCILNNETHNFLFSNRATWCSVHWNVYMWNKSLFLIQINIIWRRFTNGFLVTADAIQTSCNIKVFNTVYIDNCCSFDNVTTSMHIIIWCLCLLLSIFYSFNIQPDYDLLRCVQRPLWNVYTW